MSDINERLQRIESKLDAYLEKAAKQETDLVWVRGYIKTSITSIISLAIGLVVTFLKTLKP